MNFWKEFFLFNLNCKKVSILVEHTAVDRTEKYFPIFINVVNSRTVAQHRIVRINNYVLYAADNKYLRSWHSKNALSAAFSLRIHLFYNEHFYYFRFISGRKRRSYWNRRDANVYLYSSWNYFVQIRARFI